MGVQGLWKLLESTGRPVSLESLEGKVLAVDVSLWLHQAMRGMRDQGGQAAANAHLHVLFQRICKLLFYRVRPVFVFDGSVPELKRQTTVARRQRREIAAGQSKRAAERILKSYLQSHALHTVMGGAGRATTTAPALQRAPSDNPDMYDLPALPPSVSQDSESESEDGGPSLGTDYLGQYQNLDEVDITSESFQCLPPEIQHEMLQEMRAAKKRNSWKTMDQLPKASSDFSEYQLQNLLQKGQMAKRMEVLQKEMSERHAGAAAGDLLASQAAVSVEAGRIASEDAHHYLLVKRPSVKPPAGEDDAPTDHDRPGQVGGQEPAGRAPEVKGQATPSEPQPWESDVIVIDQDSEEEADPGRETEIASVVRRFFGGRDGAPGSRQTVSRSVAEDEVVCLDQGDLTGQGSDVEVVSTEAQGSGSSNDEVVILGEERIDLFHPRTIGQFTQGAVDDDRRTDLSDWRAGHKQDSEPSETRGDPDCLPPAILSRPSGRKHCPPSAVSLDAKEDKSAGAFMRSALREGAISTLDTDKQEKEETGPRTLELSDRSSDDDDFVEVLEQPVGPSRPDELFPVGAFTPSVVLSEAASATDSQAEASDIHPPSITGPREAIHLAPPEEETAQEAIEESDGSADGEDVEAEDEGLEARREDARREWQAMNVSDASQLQENLAAQRQVLQLERGKQERVAASITDVMYAESKELLELFGLPYVVSPEEAEAQCAHLDRTEQTQGTITDDSDVWLFGARHVYRNIFSRARDVEFYKSADLEKQLFLDRDKLIALAMLLGSDYTEGVKGVGWVTAMEVLAEFPGRGVDPLQALKAWWQAAQDQLMPPVETPLKSKLRNLTLQDSFPNRRVYQAYWSPAVDESQEEFSWQSPDLGLLRDFAKDKLGWTRAKADEVLLPVMKKLNENSIQKKITPFLHAEGSQSRQVTSKRLRRVLKSLGRPQGEGEDEDEVERKGGARKRGGKARKKAAVTETVAGGTVTRETVTGVRRNRRGAGRRKKQSEDAVPMATDSNKDAASEIGDGYTLSKQDEEEEESEEEEEESEEEEEEEESSDEEFTVPKRIRLEAGASVSPSPGFPRKRRSAPRGPTEPIQEEPGLLAEFLEIEEAVSRKTEGGLPTAKAGEPMSSHKPPATEERMDSSKLPSKGRTVAATLAGGRGRAGKGRGQGGKGRGSKGKGRPGRKGAGKAGVREASNLRTTAGPLLSESSSSDSDN